MVLILELVTIFWIFEIAVAANILGMYTHMSQSHHILGASLLKELAKRGHNVTMVSAFPLSEKIENYTDISIPGVLNFKSQKENVFLKMYKSLSWSFIEGINLVKAETELTINDTEIYKLIKSGIKFDVIVMDLFASTPQLILGKVFDAPIVLTSAHGIAHWTNHFTGNPSPPSYVPQFMLPLIGNKMTFMQRVLNGIFSVISVVIAEYLKICDMKLLRKYYSDYFDATTYEDLRNTIAIILSNSHVSFESARPLVPNIIPVGGLHVKAGKKLPQDLEEFISGAKDGAILFSLGTNMKSSLLPRETCKSILKAFRKSKQQILWKFEDDSLISEKPDNVLIRKWLPQNDILAHKNVKLFISHGGIASMIESIYHAVPVLGIPIFGDQKVNIMNAVVAGYALQLELFEITEDNLSNAIAEIINNTTFRENVKKKSELLRDQPLSPMNTAIFWVEYVIRHKGAPHLQIAGIDLPWYQYFMLDVAIFILALILILILIIRCTILSCIRVCTPRQKKEKRKEE